MSPCCGPVPGAPGIDPCRNGGIIGGVSCVCIFVFALFALREDTPYELGVVELGTITPFAYLLQPEAPPGLRLGCILSLANALLKLARYRSEKMTRHAADMSRSPRQS